MKKFNFKLESVLKYRKILCDQAKEDLAKANKERQDIEAELHAVDEEEVRQREKFKENQSMGQIDVRHILHQLSYMAHLGLCKKEIKHDLAENKKKIDEKRAAYLDKSRDQKALEKLKDKNKLDHIKDALREEQAAIDESAITRHSRKIDDEKNKNI